jgi:hypothetical protein
MYRTTAKSFARLSLLRYLSLREERGHELEREQLQL